MISKQLTSIYKDRDENKLPEKILDVFLKNKLMLTSKCQKSFIQWFMKYNKYDFFLNFFNNIIILEEDSLNETKKTVQ